MGRTRLGHGGRRRRAMARGLLPVLVAMAVAVPFGGAAAASAATRPVVSFVSGRYSVKADGTTWFLQVLGGVGTIEVTLGRGTPTPGVELHEWQIHGLPSASVTRTGSGSWRIAPPASSISPLLQLNLLFVATKKTAVACAKGSEERYAGTLKGVLELNTGFRHVGTIGSRSISFHSPSLANTVIVNAGCKLAKPPCPPASGVTFTAGQQGLASYAWGAPASASAELTGVFRVTPLAKPAHAERVDGAEALEPQPTLSGTTLSVTTGSGTLLSGDATVTGATPLPSTTQSCFLKGVEHTETTTGEAGPFSASPLVATTLLTGKVSSGTSGFGEVFTLTLS